MAKTTIHVEGMMCGMCEAHVADAIRRVFTDAKKVKASHKKDIVTFVTENAPDEEVLKNIIDSTGYTYVSAEIEG